MFSERIPSSALFDELIWRPENLKLKQFFGRRRKNCFPVCFFEGVDLKIKFSWHLKGVNMYIPM